MFWFVVNTVIRPAKKTANYSLTATTTNSHSHIRSHCLPTTVN